MSSRSYMHRGILYFYLYGAFFSHIYPIMKMMERRRKMSSLLQIIIRKQIGPIFFIIIDKLDEGVAIL